MRLYLEFEKPVADIEGKILELKGLKESDDHVDLSEEIRKLEAKSAT